MAKLTQLKIKNSAGKEYVALINPNEIRENFSVTYTEEEMTPIGTLKPDIRFVRVDPDNLTIKLIIDGTGAIDPDAPTASVQLKKLKDVVLAYLSAKHETPVLTITWGEAVKQFTGRMLSMSIDYSLFTVNGAPIRAEVNMEFKEDTPPATDSKKRNTNSPDLTHIVRVKAGDTLPDMCQNIYGNSNMYLEIARINSLINFRNLKAGTDILFPPIREVE